jgi:hypothetical protein
LPLCFSGTHHSSVGTLDAAPYLQQLHSAAARLIASWSATFLSSCVPTAHHVTPSLHSIGSVVENLSLQLLAASSGRRSICSRSGTSDQS